MSVRYDNQLVLIGKASDIAIVLPGLIEQGWLIQDHDRLCIKLKHLGQPLCLPTEIATNHRLSAMLSCLETGYNSIRLEVSDLGFSAHEHRRGLQGLLYPSFGGIEPHEVHDLTPEVARQVAVHDRDVTLPMVTSVSPEAAAILAGHEDSLSLPGVKSLSAETAHELANHRGPLALDGLLELTVELAREFAASTATLSFGGLTRVTPEAIEVLAAGMPHPQYGQFGRRSRDFSGLQLDGLKTLSPELARAIARHPGNISLGGLQEFTPDAARELTGCRWGCLVLRGLRTLTEQVAALLGDTDVGLILSGLRRLTPGVAAGLAQTRGGLFLNGVQALSLQAAQALAGHRGHLGLVGVTEAPEEVLAALAEHDGPVVLGLEGGLTLHHGEREPAAGGQE
jgi:hypothetical protein